VNPRQVEGKGGGNKRGYMIRNIPSTIIIPHTHITHTETPHFTIPPWTTPSSIMDPQANPLRELETPNNRRIHTHQGTRDYTIVSANSAVWDWDWDITGTLLGTCPVSTSNRASEMSSD
jgi:hypothetical protein